jgi:RND superfamily putative drug exporter
VGTGVLVALAGSMTLVPSIVLILPNSVFWPNVGRRFEGYAQSVERSIEKKMGYFSKSAGFSIKHAKLVVVASLLATAPALYVWGTAPVGYDFLAAAPKNLESVSAFNAMSQSFGAGKLFPTYAVIQFRQPLWNGSSYNVSEMRAVDSVTNLTLSLSNVDSVTGPTRPSGQRIDFSHLGNDSRSRLLESSIDDAISKDGYYALLNIDLAAPPESEASIGTAQQLRNSYQSFLSGGQQPLQGIYLGGAAGGTLDSKNTVNTQFDTVILYVMAGVGAVLLVVLGSLFLPLFAIVSIVMSIAWTLEATDLVFQRLYSFPLLFITPLTLFVLLLGLGMDYNIFILTRIREEATKGVPLKGAITTAVERTGGIITAAALILAGSLGALMLSSNLLLKEFGFAFFFSILIDAMIMRTYVVPSVMSLMGKWNWYAPGRLQRVRMKDAT